MTRFRREARVARQISHPNVCRVYDIGKVGDQNFLSMEYVDGEDLASELRRLGRPSQEKALEIARQLCAGLDAAHKEGILHRDLKPANVMIDGRGRVRITDFGLAGFADELEAHHALSGTPAYMAPEQLMGRGVTARSDIYSLGLILFEVFSGVRYRDEVTQASPASDSRPEETDVSLSSLVPDLDPQVEKVVAWCLAEDPAQRPRSALSVAAALPGGDPLAAALEAGETPSPEMVAEAGGTGDLSVRAAWLFLGTALALMLLGVYLSDRVGLTRLAMPSKAPLVLAEAASALTRELGYPPHEHSVYGLRSELRYVEFLDRQDLEPNPLAQALPGEPGPISFWYRESPARMIPEYRIRMVGVGAWGKSVSRAGVTLDNPPMSVPGMVLVRLDSEGRLLEFEAVPPESVSPDVRSHDPDFSPLFREAGIQEADTKPASPTLRPKRFADRLDAWEVSTLLTAPIRVVAAAVAGRPSSFRVLGPWDVVEPVGSSGQSFRAELASSISLVLYYAAFLGSVLLGIHNLRRGRADRHGATRLAVAVFSLKMLGWYLSAGQLAVFTSGSLDLVILSSGDALQSAVRYWFYYVAIEPYARRLWPRCLIGWSRALSGRLRDAQVGRELLVGACFGAAWFFMARLGALIATRLGTLPDLVTTGYWLRPAVTPFSELLYQVIDAVFFCLWPATTMILLLVLTKRKWLVLTMFVFIWTPVGALATNHWIFWLVWALRFASSVYLLARFGVLAVTVAIFAAFTLDWFPVTLDLSVWYLHAALLPLLACGAIAVHGFSAAVRGRPLFRDALMRSPAQ